MNHHSHPLFIFSIRAWVAFVSVFATGLLCCLSASATQIVTQPCTWGPTRDLSVPRAGHTATSLANGKVLVAGGGGSANSSFVFFNSAELYDPASGTWGFTGSLKTARSAHTATLLADGKVLVAGGTDDPHGGVALTSAEVYDPDTTSWSATGNLGVARKHATATLLADGRVLVTGGVGTEGVEGERSFPLDSAELYDPATGMWSGTGKLNIARSGHTATLLQDGKVLVVGGASPSIHNSAEIYDPATGSWTATSDLIRARIFFTATLLANGKVLVAGGAVSDHCDGLDAPAELYDPATGQWSATGRLANPRAGHTATLLPNGKVLVTGGDHECNLLSSAELYDPASGRWSVTRSLNTARSAHTATLLGDSKVLVAGGDSRGILNSAELFGDDIPQITGASVRGKKLFVEGKDFSDGAEIFLNGEKQKTAKDELSPATLLIAKKAGKRIARGETVRLRVRNCDGTGSAEFSYTRPLD